MQVFTISRPWEGAWESGWVARGGGGRWGEGKGGRSIICLCHNPPALIYPINIVSGLTSANSNPRWHLPWRAVTKVLKPHDKALHGQVPSWQAVTKRTLHVGLHDPNI